jgi:4-aminobutyrate aminotransferase / (S)-3-amino-2-methylpropionate transaminase / 5-aminovalerate transaminase
MSTIKLVTEIPGPKSLEMVARREAATPRGAAKLTPLSIVQADGSTVTDADGNVLIDLAGGIGVLAVGHRPPQVVEAIREQLDELIHFCAIVGTYESYVRVAELMNEITPGTHQKKTILLNSGAEAVETAVKLARSFTGRPALIVFEGAYHGRTNLTLAMTSKYGLFKKSFGPFAPEIYRLPFPNLYRKPAEMTEDQYVDWAISQLENALIAQVDPAAVAAMVIEPVQGEGGFVPVPPRFLQRIRELCTEHGIVMVCDEIQCGFGRTGKLFASEHYGIVPDLMTTAKSLAAGMPLSAVTGRADIMDGAHPGGLGGTYSGNPLACAAAIQAIEMIRQPAFLQRANEVGDTLCRYMKEWQSECETIGDVRGLGPMLAMEFVTDRVKKTPFTPADTTQITTEALKRGVVCIRSGLYSNCVRFLPALNIPQDQLEEALTVVGEAVRLVNASKQPVTS